MKNLDVENDFELASSIMEDSEKRLMKVMRGVYRDLDRRLVQSPQDLPFGIVKKGRYRIIIKSGSPRDPAIALKPGGGFTYIKWGFARSSAKFDPPLTGPKYMEMVLETLRRLHPQ